MFNISVVQIKEKICKGEWNDILNSLCFIKENEIILDYVCFKYFANEETYKHILSNIIQCIDSTLVTNKQFIIHINMKSLSISDYDKHKQFIQEICGFFKVRYEGQLLKCYIYNAPFIFSQVFSLISIFIDKETQQKIVLITNKNKNMQNNKEKEQIMA